MHRLELCRVVKKINRVFYTVSGSSALNIWGEIFPGEKAVCLVDQKIVVELLRLVICSENAFGEFTCIAMRK